RSYAGIATSFVVSALPIMLLAILGHSAEAKGHVQAVGSLSIHLVGIVIWVGGLLSLALLAPSLTKRSDLGAIVSRYSTIALIAYALVMYSGLTNALLRVGSLADWTTAYGFVLLAKLGITILLGVGGWTHRRSVIGRMPGWEDPRAGRAAAGHGSGAGTTAGGSEATTASGAVHAAHLFWRLVLGEIMLFAAATALGVVLSRTAPPVPDDPPSRPTAAEVLTGEPLPPPPSWGTFFTEWRLDPMWVSISVGFAVFYVLAVLRLRKRGDTWPVHRTIAWLVGLAGLFYVTCGGAAFYGKVLFSSHMIQHMVLVMIVPIPLVMGAPITLLMRAIPARRDGSRGVRE